jgi:hypothetical protein
MRARAVVQQRFNVEPQTLVAGASLLEEPVARGCVLLQRGSKECLNATPSLATHAWHGLDPRIS